MVGRIVSPGAYIMVFTTLMVLTCLTVGVSFVPLPLVWHDVIGGVIGVCKATLVVLFFMHVMHSPRLTWIVIAVSVLWVGILLVLTLSDYFTRGMIPLMPGH